MAQNLMSVAASLTCAWAEDAAISIADIAEPLLEPPDETAFILPAVTVDFSAWVADMVRK